MAESSTLFLAVRKWGAEFKRGRTNLEEDPREGVQKRQQLGNRRKSSWYGLDDRRIKVNKIAEAIDILEERVGQHLYIYEEWGVWG